MSWGTLEQRKAREKRRDDRVAADIDAEIGRRTERERRRQLVDRLGLTEHGDLPDEPPPGWASPESA